MKHFGTALAGAALTALGIAACGGVSADDLFTTGGLGGASSSSSATSGSSGSTATAGSGGAASSSSGGATTASSSGGGSSSTSASSSSSTGASSSSSTSGLPATKVTCGNAECGAGQICCFNPKGPGDFCTAPGTCNPGWVVLACNGPEDCGGGACCADVDFNMQVPYLGISCKPSCNPDGQIEMCSPFNPEVCPQGTQCKKSNVLGDGYFYCGD